MTYRSAVIHTSIGAEPDTVIAFMRDLDQWKTWAPWIQSVARTSPNDWTLQTDFGVTTFQFVAPNAFGVLDHRVTLASGVTVANSVRVIANGDGSELAMTILQWPHMSAAEFDRDVEAVTADFARIKAVLEAPERKHQGRA